MDLIYSALLLPPKRAPVNKLLCAALHHADGADGVGRGPEVQGPEIKDAMHGALTVVRSHSATCSLRRPHCYL